MVQCFLSSSSQNWELVTCLVCRCCPWNESSSAWCGSEGHVLQAGVILCSNSGLMSVTSSHTWSETQVKISHLWSAHNEAVSALLWAYCAATVTPPLFPLITTSINGTINTRQRQGVNLSAAEGLRVKREAYHISRVRVKAARSQQSAFSLSRSFIQPGQFSCALFFLSLHRKAAPRCCFRSWAFLLDSDKPFP